MIEHITAGKTGILISLIFVIVGIATLDGLLVVAGIPLVIFSVWLENYEESVNNGGDRT